MVKQITVEELKSKMDSDVGLCLVDCREADEHEYCKIDGAKLIPLSEFQERGPKELNPDEEIFIHCHHGGRSQKACEFLESQGFKSTHNVTGGIEAWSLQIDSKVKRY